MKRNTRLSSERVRIEREEHWTIVQMYATAGSSRASTIDSSVQHRLEEPCFESSNQTDVDTRGRHSRETRSESICAGATATVTSARQGRRSRLTRSTNQKTVDFGLESVVVSCHNVFPDHSRDRCRRTRTDDAPFTLLDDRYRSGSMELLIVRGHDCQPSNWMRRSIMRRTSINTEIPTQRRHCVGLVMTTTTSDRWSQSV